MVSFPLSPAPTRNGQIYNLKGAAYVVALAASPGTSLIPVVPAKAGIARTRRACTG